MYYLGCDQHKKYSFVVAKDHLGNTVDQHKLYHADKDLMKQYFSSLPPDSIVALEACGFDHWLGDMLEDLGLNFKLAHTAKTKAIAEERIKTDKISASVLADLLRADLLPQAYRPPLHVRHARALMRYRQSLVWMRSSIKNRIHAIIDYHGIQQSFSDLFGASGRQFLAQLNLPAPYSAIIENYLSLIDLFSDLIHKSDALLRRQLKSNPSAKLLTSIPGIGLITAHIILAEIGDITRFPNRHKLVRYIGIVPSLHQSGQILFRGRITKQGNKYLRTAFIESAQTAIRRDPYLHNHFMKIKTKKGYGVAIVAVAHKLVKSTYKVLIDQKPYRFRTLYRSHTSING